MWGPHNLVSSAAECCRTCREHRSREEASGKQGCLVWVFCAAAGGCGTQKAGECWGKAGVKQDAHGAALKVPPVRSSGKGVPWVSGAAFTPAEAAAVAAAEAAVVHERQARRDRPGNPRVFLDVTITPPAAADDARGGESAAADAAAAAAAENGGRIEFVLYAHESPRAAENFRAMCTGERGGAKTFKGMKFYRIIDLFIDQAGAGGGSVWGGAFDDDPGGLRLRHDRPGLLSAANAGPDTNSGHFSIVVAPAPHLDAGYTIFGEVTSGFNVMMAINRLDKGNQRPGYARREAQVAAAGCTANCAPRPDVKPKCATRETATRPVQGRPTKPCID